MLNGDMRSIIDRERMPTFEMVVLIRRLERAQLKEALKRSAGYVFEFGGTLRSMENLGLRNLPYVIKANGKKHIHAHCFVLNFDSGLEQPKLMAEKFRLDLDVVRATKWLRARSIMDLHEEKKPPDCTMHLDLLPAPYRPNVIALQELAAKRVKKHTHKNYEDKEFLVY